MSGIIIFDTVSGFVRRTFSGLIGLFTDERTGPFLAGVLIALGLVVLVYVIGSWLVACSIIRASVAAVKIAKRLFRKRLSGRGLNDSRRLSRPSWRYHVDPCHPGAA